MQKFLAEINTFEEMNWIEVGTLQPPFFEAFRLSVEKIYKCDTEFKTPIFDSQIGLSPDKLLKSV